MASNHVQSMKAHIEWAMWELKETKVCPLLHNSKNMNEEQKQMREKLMGAIIAVYIGDVLGAPVETFSARDLKEKFGVLFLIGQEVLPSSLNQSNESKKSFGTFYDRQFGPYTDDTEMTMALMHSIIHCHKPTISAKHIADAYVSFYTQNRGYGKGAQKIMQGLAKPEGDEEKLDFRSSGTSQFPTGSYANGGCMRMAPVAFVCRNATNDILHQVVKAALLPTHVHEEGIDSAFVQAKATAILFNTKDPTKFSAIQWIESLISIAKTEPMQQKLTTILNYHKNKTPVNNAETSALFVKHSFDGKEDLEPEVQEDLELFEKAEIAPFQIRGVDAVTVCVHIFAKYFSLEQPWMPIVRVIAVGGDVDTTAAMIGPFIGALIGGNWIPTAWYKQLDSNICNKLQDYCDKLSAIEVLEYSLQQDLAQFE